MSYNGRIPVPGFVSSVRKTTYLDRKEILNKRQEEKEKLDKQQKQAVEIAKLLNQKWAAEDKKKGDRKADNDDGHRRDRASRRSRSADRRRFREHSDDDRPHKADESRRSRDDEDSRRPQDSTDELRRGIDQKSTQDRQLGRRFRESGTDGAEEDSSLRAAPMEEPVPVPATGSLSGPLLFFNRSQPSEPAEIGGWQTGEAGPGKIPDAGDKDRKRKITHSDAVAKKFAGVFGMDDSDDEKEKSKAVLAKKKGPAGGQATPSFKPLSMASGSTAMASTAGASPTGAPGTSVVAVQMKVAAWKAGLKGKAAIMPIELQQEVAAVMGMANGR